MIILDIEASGTEYGKHSIVSLGALDSEHPENQLYLECRIWDGAHIMDGALAVNGFTEAEITDQNKMTEAELIRNFLGWAKEIKDQTLCGQNISFDRDFVKAACERAGEVFPLAYRTIDTHTLAYMHMVKRGLTPPFDATHHRTALNLDRVLEYCGILAEPTPHNALTGALCHAEVASRLLHDQKLLSQFTDYPIPWQV